MDINNVGDWIKPHEAIIIGNFFEKRDIVTCEFIEQLVAKSCPCIITKEKFVPTIDPKLLATCEQCCLPILAVPNNYSWSDLMAPVYEEIIKVQRKKLELESRLIEVVIKQLLATPEIDDMAQAITSIMGCPVALVNHARDIVSSSNNWDWTGSKELLETVKPQHFGTSDKGLEILTYAYPSKRHDLQIVCYPIEDAGFLLDALLLVLPAKTKHFYAQIQTSISLLSDVFKLKTTLYREAYKIHNEFKELFFAKLTAGESISPADYLKFEQSTEKRLYDSYLTCAISAQSSVLKTQESTLPLYQKMNEIFETGLGSAMSEVYPEFKQLTFEHEGLLYLFIPTASTPAKPQIKHLLERLETAIGQVLFMGVAKVCSISDLHQGIRCAQEALSAAVHLGGSERFQSYEKLGFLRLLIQKDGQINTVFSEELLSNYIEPLRLWDNNHNSELLRTMRMYIKQNSSIKKTAYALNIHVNTLRARFVRIEEILSIDLGDSNDLLNLQIALKLDEERLRHRL